MIVGLIFFLVVLLLATAFMINGLITIFRFGLPYVPSPQWAITSLVKTLSLSPEQSFVEIGCGDGRVLSAVARAFPNNPCLGYELQWWPYLLAKWRCRSYPNIRLIRKNIVSESLPPNAILFGYFLSTMNRTLQTHLNALAQTRALILLGFALPNRQPVHVDSAPAGRVGTLRWYQPST